MPQEINQELERILNEFEKWEVVENNFFQWQHEYLSAIITQSFLAGQKSREEEIKKNFYEEFAGAGELWFPYIGVGAKNREEEMQAVDDYWERVLTKQ